MINITRIYQGRILSAEFEKEELRCKTDCCPFTALMNTHSLFQDAVNYHLVALAGMCNGRDVPVASEFAERIKSIWTTKPRNKDKAETLQESVARTLNLRNPTFAQAVDEIFCGVENREVLPFVLKYIMDSTLSGEGAIQQNGKELLPKLCNPEFTGNFDFSRKERKARAGLLKLRERLKVADADELRKLALEMDLSWTCVKTLPDSYYPIEDGKRKIDEAVSDFISMLRKDDPVLCERLRQIIDSGTSHPDKPLPKCKGCKGISEERRKRGILFMYYPCEDTAKILADMLPMPKGEESDEWDILSHMNEDPIIMTRGKRGYVYKGFSALPCWDSDGNGTMYEKKWDILAFSEALKAVHGFDLKQKEREQEREDIQKKLDYMRYGKGVVSAAGEDDAELPVLYGDSRLEAVKALVEELTVTENEPYTLTTRSLNAYENVVRAWKECLRQGRDDTASLQSCVRKVQSETKRFGSQPLFDCLCKPEYRCIWLSPPPDDKYTRAENILEAYGLVQIMERDLIDLSEPVRVTAAEARFSPRPIMYSDLTNLGVDAKKACEYVAGEKGMMRLGVVVRNAKGRWRGAHVRVRYSAPRFVRDQIGEDSACWSSKAGADPKWIQPMLKALDLSSERLPVMGKHPATALAVSFGAESEDNLSLYLNFPVTLDVEPLHRALGKNERWNGQFCGGKDAKLHLHWPDTIKKAESAWWKNESILRDGFSVLSVDLGVRYAAAYSIVKVAGTNAIKSLNDRDVVNRVIGNADGKNWYGAVVHQGLIKLDGEGRSTRIEVCRNSHAGNNRHGVRRAEKSEREAIIRLFKPVRVIPWFTDKKDKQISISELNKEAIRLFSRLLSRVRRFSSWVYKLTQADKRESVSEDIKQYFEKVGKDFLPELSRALDAGDWATFEKGLKDETVRLRNALPTIAEGVTNSVLPQQRYKWEWKSRSVPGLIGSGIMERKEDIKPQKIHRYFMGGLSVERLSQLERLRQCLQSMNRLLYNELGREVNFGRATRNESVGDPCPEILKKIETIRNERVNRIAHDIVAQALGVRLSEQKTVPSSDAQGRDVYHGSYERIIGREPVDFVVLENLSRYLTKKDRSPEENTTLMRWSHRHIVAKVKQLLTEVFGIPVLEVPAAYTSRYDYSDSVPGFRAEHIPDCTEMDETDKKLTEAYEILSSRIPKELMDKFHLFRPRDKGEFFIARHEDGRLTVRNADMNASANIAWRALAAPDAFDLLQRLRLKTNSKGELQLRNENAREKANKGLKLIEETVPRSAQSKHVTVFYGRIVGRKPLCFVENDDTRIPFSHYRDIWGYLNESKQREICRELNIGLLKRFADKTGNSILLADILGEDGDEIPL